MKQLTQSGFTIVELTIATGIFSVILLLLATALINIGNTYHKGIISAGTQDAARVIIDDLSRQVRYSSSPPPTVPNTSTYNGLVVNSFCLGETRYTYALDTQVVDNVADGTYDSARHRSLHAFWRDTAVDPTYCLPANLTRSNPSASTGTITVGSVQVNANGVLGSGRELVPANTRLRSFGVTNPQAKLWRIQVGLVYGDNELLVRSSLPNGPITGCVNTNSGGNFCGLSDLTTEVYRVL